MRTIDDSTQSPEYLVGQVAAHLGGGCQQHGSAWLQGSDVSFLHIFILLSTNRPVESREELWSLLASAILNSCGCKGWVHSAALVRNEPCGHATVNKAHQT
jgi:hypothetical protein